MLFCPAEVVAGSAAWLGKGLSCVCAQRRDSDSRLSFDLTPAEVNALLSNFEGHVGLKSLRVNIL